MTVHPDPPGPGQESVWSYPRPAIAERCSRHIRIVHRGRIIADTMASIRTLETSHPPSYYIPLPDIMPGALQPSTQRSFCEWKGDAAYFDLVVDGARLRNVAWSLKHPLIFYFSLLGECFDRRDSRAFTAFVPEKLLVFQSSNNINSYNQITRGVLSY
jgi:uncharacterized protein (DUF427 family)